MSKVIKTGVFGIEVTLEEDGSGSIVSTMGSGHGNDPSDDPADTVYDAAIGGLESLILAHACAGIDITTPAYLEGIETAVEAIVNNI